MIELVDSEQESNPELLGNSTTTAVRNMLAEVLKGTPKLFPHANLPITEGSRPSTSHPGNISILLPVRNHESGAVIAALMLSGYGLDEQYAEMLKCWMRRFAGRGLFDQSTRGDVDFQPLCGPPRRTAASTRSSRFPRANPNNQPIMVCDPGINLLGGSRPSRRFCHVVANAPGPPRQLG